MEFAYGKPDQLNQEGAGAVTSSWQYHNPKGSDDSTNPRNFKALNKKAVISGNVTAKENYKFRKTNDARIPFGMSALKGHQRGISLPHESFSYGRANRPQTPLGGIITNNFGEMAGQEL